MKKHILKKENKLKDSLKKKIFPVLVFISILLLIIILVQPFIPLFWYSLKSNEIQNITNETSTLNLINKFKDNFLKEDVDLEKTDVLIIPSIGVNIEVIESAEESVLDNGAWKRPYTSTPDKGGNTVITAHRFQYNTDPSKMLYNLDKVEVGDIVYLYWKGEEYIYKVYEITIVNEDDVSIEYPSAESILTLYTCTPMWTNTHRLVVKAELINLD